MSVTDKPHSHGGMQVDFSKLNEQQRAMVENILSRNPAAQSGDPGHCSGMSAACVLVASLVLF